MFLRTIKSRALDRQLSPFRGALFETKKFQFTIREFLEIKLSLQNSDARKEEHDDEKTTSKGSAN